MGSTLARIFVYGTLMPGHLRWGLLAPVSVGVRPASARGRLYDTGEGWPAASLGDWAAGGHVAADEVPGWVVDVRPSALDSVLDLLDEVEDGFERVRILTVAGEDVWAYSVPLPVPPTWASIEAWTSQVER